MSPSYSKLYTMGLIQLFIYTQITRTHYKHSYIYLALCSKYVQYDYFNLFHMIYKKYLGEKKRMKTVFITIHHG